MCFYQFKFMISVKNKECDFVLKSATFSRGGVHPADKKSLSKDKCIERLPLPEELIVSMSQHLGAPAKALKAKGDLVSKGELIGQASSFISADVHSPVDGVVTEVRKVELASGAVADALVIKVNEEQSDPFTETFDWKSQSKEEIQALIKAMGIVGMGGATFPTSVKFSIPLGKKVEYLVINGAECEPYLTCDYRLMLEKTDEVLEGIMVASKAVEPGNIIIGVELNKADAIELLDSRVKALGYPIKVQPLKMKYPQGDEKQLLKACINREIPSGKLPLDIGAVVCNLGTAYAIYEAAKLHKPLFERVITISGESVVEPKNVIAPIGTKFSYLLEYAGGVKDDLSELISGGPMMGFGVSDDQTPTLKGSSGLLAVPLTIDDSKQFPCVSCGKCVQHCPMGLQPNKMFRLIKNGRYQEAMSDYSLMDCKECGCCAYTCPSHIPLVQGFKLGKKLGRRK